MNPSADMLETALRTLPHGPEFRFIDRLISLTPGKEGVGEYRVRGDEPVLPGHFPGEPLFPGVLLVEAAAQLAGIVAQTDCTIPPLGKLRLAALRNVKILGTAKPGDTFSIRAAITGRLGTLIQAEAECFFQERTILTASLTLGGSQTARDNPIV
jgi:3-hydroxyacyl-[acyl-carrier-protein] dehydratase